MRPPVTELDANGAHGVGDVSPGCDVMGWPFGGLSLKPHDPDAVMRRASGEAERRDTLQAPGQCVSELPRSPHVRPLADWRRLAGLRGREGHSHWGSWTGQEAKRGPAARSMAPIPGGAPRGVIGRIRHVGLTGALSHRSCPCGVWGPSTLTKWLSWEAGGSRQTFVHKQLENVSSGKPIAELLRMRVTTHLQWCVCPCAHVCACL